MAKNVVEQFWQAMQSNDFVKASQWLSEDIVCDWVLSNERIIGRDNFIAINNNYPTSTGCWDFVIKSLVAEGDQVVTDVDVTDGEVSATVVTFHTVEDGLIARQVEYWVENYEAQEWRKQWVCPIVSE